MIATVSKRGNSVWIMIPPEIIASSGISEWDKVEITGNPTAASSYRRKRRMPHSRRPLGFFIDSRILSLYRLKMMLLQWRWKNDA